MIFDFIDSTWLMYGVSVAILSLLAFAMYGIDKRAAKIDRTRISERKLHQVSLIGGWPGALIGQQVFRHKTRKTSFQIAYWATVFVHIGVVIAIANVR